MKMQPSTTMRLNYHRLRQRNLRILKTIGWTQVAAEHWRNPRGLRIVFTTADAIKLEQLRGGIPSSSQNVNKSKRI